MKEKESSRGSQDDSGRGGEGIGGNAKSKEIERERAWVGRRPQAKERKEAQKYTVGWRTTLVGGST